MITHITNEDNEEVWSEDTPSSSTATSCIAVVMAPEDSKLATDLYLGIQKESINMEKKDVCFSIDDLDFSIVVQERYAQFMVNKLHL